MYLLATEIRSLSRRERLDLDWTSLVENKITLLTHNLHDFPPFDPFKKNGKGESIPMWEDDIREKVGLVG